MNLADADKEIRALARRLGVKAHQVRAALETMDEDAPAPVVLASAVRTGRAATAQDMTPVPASEKERPVRSPAYLRAVASLPCCACEREGASQAAHINRGKGMGLKAPDNHTFPLCATVGGKQGCHELYDQYKLGDKHASAEMGQAWVKNTYWTLKRAGRVPLGVPPPRF
ncbi:MAG TPA: hypothetical protein VFH49_08695 [Aquabacterium sp.]|nr:hypothetical protein [Aquabacterium sp.]